EGAASAGWNPTTVVRGIENQCFSAYSSHEVAARFVRKLGCVDAVYVVENRAIGLVVVVNCVVIAERAFHIQAPVIFCNVLSTKTGISSTLQWRRQESNGSSGVLGRP